jgi:hypothetical protein
VKNLNDRSIIEASVSAPRQFITQATPHFNPKCLTTAVSGWCKSSNSFGQETNFSKPDE